MNFNEIEDIIEEYDFLNEGAYSNGRYEHPDDKKKNKKKNIPLDIIGNN